MTWRLFFLSLAFSPLCAFPAKTKFTYGSPAVELSGTLNLQTFPGAPNYESIESGDDIERHFYLKLDASADVTPNEKISDIENQQVEKNVKVLQLAISEEDAPLWAAFRKAGKGAHVKILGTLFHRFTGHHHSRVLMEVQKMQVLQK